MEIGIKEDEDSKVIETEARGTSNAQPQLPPKPKRKHRRGKSKANTPYKNNWHFQAPHHSCNYGKCNKGGDFGIGGNGSNAVGRYNRIGNRARAKLARSRSLVPYNTNKFLMEEHLAEVPNALLTPSGRTRDSSFSMDSEDNYFYSLPEDEEEFLSKEFANVYETARVERLESLTKQQLINECLQIEDKYSTDQGTQHQQQLAIQRISSEFMVKIRILEEEVKKLKQENYNLRGQLMSSVTMAAVAAASPPSAAAPIGAACEPTPMDSSSEDSESDSSTSSSTSSSSSARRSPTCSPRCPPENENIENWNIANISACDAESGGCELNENRYAEEVIDNTPTDALSANSVQSQLINTSNTDTFIADVEKKCSPQHAIDVPSLSK